MSYEASKWAYEQTGLTSAQSAILAALAFKSREEGGEMFCFPGQQTIVEMTKISRRTVSRSLSDLEENGYLKRVKRFRKNGSRTSDKYVLNMSQPSATMTPSEDSTMCHHDRRVGATMTPPMCHHDTPTLIVSEYKGSNIKLSNAQDAQHPPAQQDRFEEFWETYPRKAPHANPKKPAREKFKKITKTTNPQLLIDAAHAYAKTRQNENPKFTAQAITWLNQERWNDDYTTQPGTTSTTSPGTLRAQNTLALAQQFAQQENQQHEGTQNELI